METKKRDIRKHKGGRTIAVHCLLTPAEAAQLKAARRVNGVMLPILRPSGGLGKGNGWGNLRVLGRSLSKGASRTRRLQGNPGLVAADVRRRLPRFP